MVMSLWHFIKSLNIRSLVTLVKSLDISSDLGVSSRGHDISLDKVLGIVTRVPVDSLFSV